MSVPNQKIVRIEKRTQRDRNHLYATMNLNALSEAVSTLNGSGLKMWLYFNKNQEGFRMELSQKECNRWGIKKDSYYNGLKELEEKRYLVPVKEGSNVYCFYEIAQSEKTKSPQYEKWFFEKSEVSSDFLTHNSDFQIRKSKNPERNNTYTTEITQDKTMGTSFPINRTAEMDKLGF